MDISAATIKQLREQTGAGVLDCRKALEQTEGDLERARAWLKDKGLAQAAKKADRVAKDGLIGSYIHHNNRIAVLIEVNCETDFSGKTQDFTDFVKNMAMQIAATSPIAIDRESISPEVLAKERDIYLTQAKESGKPEKVWEKIVEGKVTKFYSEACLLEQPYVKNSDIKVQDVLNELIAKTGENIIIRRFIRYQLGDSNG